MVAQAVFGYAHLTAIQGLLCQRPAHLFDEKHARQQQFLVLVAESLLHVPIMAQLVFYESDESH